MSSVYQLSRMLSKESKHPFDEVDWRVDRVFIESSNGDVVFEMDSAHFPDGWSQNAMNIVASRYFCDIVGRRETSVRDMIGRVVNTITCWGEKQGYLESSREHSHVEAVVFADELTYLLLHQMASFNSPVWFNVGLEEKPQVSACFINAVEDSLESIMELAKTEVKLFKHGSGTGTNLSTLRSSREKVTKGGLASGPISFMKCYDVYASVIKSGGKLRRAAKMQILNAEHPDIVAFVGCKTYEEGKARALVQAGYDAAIDGEAYESVFFQNSNLSVRVNGEFMKAFMDDEDWELKAVMTGEVIETMKARDLMRMISESAHACGDPGLQFDDNTNEWNTCLDAGRINSSNPCGEFVFLDNSACNLASLNLLKFRNADGSFNSEMFKHAVHVMTTAMEILVDSASYPTEVIAQNSHDYRPLGLGYANLGALLMSNGLVYDSDEARSYAGAVTALMTGQAYRTSALIASRVGPFPKYRENERTVLNVLEKHLGEVCDNPVSHKVLWEDARTVWEEAVDLSKEHGVRNAQTTLLAPTGTISFMMDCDTTGIEPELALVKYKKLVGGGTMKIENRCVRTSLESLGYESNGAIIRIMKYLDEHDTVEGAPGLEDAHLPVFDCAFKPEHGERSIGHMGHIKMMAAVQPFLSGAISKTVNLPSTITVEEIEELYVESWELGLKSVAMYRDGCKTSQPLTTDREGDKDLTRKRLPDERHSITHKFEIGGKGGYITVGKYEDGTPGELFVKMAKQGSTIAGLVDVIATLTSLALQYGIPLDVLVKKFANVRFEPLGWTKTKKIPVAKSVVDYVFRWLGLKFLGIEKVDGNDVDHTDD